MPIAQIAGLAALQDDVSQTAGLVKLRLAEISRDNGILE